MLDAPSDDMKQNLASLLCQAAGILYHAYYDEDRMLFVTNEHVGVIVANAKDAQAMHRFLEIYRAKIEADAASGAPPPDGSPSGEDTPDA